jgi:hypothetical protein
MITNINNRCTSVCQIGRPPWCGIACRQANRSASGQHCGRAGNLRTSFITPSNGRGSRPGGIAGLSNELTTCRGCCAFESACALPATVIRGFETSSSQKTSRARRYQRSKCRVRSTWIISTKPGGLAMYGDDRMCLDFFPLRQLIGITVPDLIHRCQITPTRTTEDVENLHGKQGLTNNSKG